MGTSVQQGAPGREHKLWGASHRERRNNVQNAAGLRCDAALCQGCRPVFSKVTNPHKKSNMSGRVWERDREKDKRRKCVNIVRTCGKGSEMLTAEEQGVGMFHVAYTCLTIYSPPHTHTVFPSTEFSCLGKLAGRVAWSRASQT